MILANYRNLVQSAFSSRHFASSKWTDGKVSGKIPYTAIPVHGKMVRRAELNETFHVLANDLAYKEQCN